MFAKVFIFAFLATSLTLAKKRPEVSEVRLFVELASKPLWRIVGELSNEEYRKIVTSGIDSTAVKELKLEVAQFTKGIKKTVADSKEALVLSLKEAQEEGAEKLEEAKKVALENIEKAKTTIKSKYEELAKRIDEAIKNKQTQ